MDRDAADCSPDGARSDSRRRVIGYARSQMPDEECRGRTRTAVLCEAEPAGSRATRRDRLSALQDAKRVELYTALARLS